MLIEPPTAEQLAAIRASAGITEEEIKDAVKEIKKWLEEQPHLPNEYEEVRQRLLFLRCKGNMKKVQESLNTYYSTKTNTPDINNDTDPLKPWFKETSEVCFVLPLPALTDDMCRVVIAGILDPSVSKHNARNTAKMAYIVHEALHMEEFCPSYRSIIDLNHVSPRHFALYPFSLIRTIFDFGLIGYRSHLKSVHFVNAPAWIRIIVACLKFIMKPKLFDRVHIHRNGVGSLHEYVPQRVLPNEYGGNAGPLKNLWESCQQNLISRREWLLKQEKYKVDESKRPRIK